MSDIEEEFINWEKGTPEVAVISVLFIVILGLPMLLENQQFLMIPAVIFYIILYIVGFFGHIDDINKDSFDKVEKNDLVVSVAIGLLGFLAIQVLFFLGLTLLATSEGSLTMDKWQLLIFNLTFVIAGEELVFRDTLPYLLSRMFIRIGLDEKLSVSISMVLSSIAFGLLHIWTYGFDTLAVAKAILAGVILGIIRIYGGLFASYLAHLTYNSMNIIGLFVFPI